CSSVIEVNTVDDKGSWGLENDNWCGIVSDNKTDTSNASPANLKDDNYCWANYISPGYPCCQDDNGVRETINMDGEWGVENDVWCGYRNSEIRWNDREKVDSTREAWNTFKQKWDNEYKNDFERLSVFVGEDESMLNFGWYSTTNIKPLIRYGTKEDMSDAKEFSGTNEYFKELMGKKYYTNKVTISGLRRKSTYYYQRNLNGNWESPIKFNTYDPDNFKFIFVGDPQIGGSNNRLSVINKTKSLTVPEGTRNDAFNWNVTITNSFAFTREPSLLLSAGDQADSDCYEMNDENHYNQETQYSAFLLPELMKTIPSATAVGNHESFTENYRHHFNLPHAYTTPEYTQVKDFNGVVPGYSYFFKYNNVLVVVLETNYNNCDDFENVIENAVKKYPDTDWRIAMFHHDIYGNGYIHSKEEYITQYLRPCLTDMFDDYEFDLVINGHDHVYSASHFISFSQKMYDPYKIDQIEKGKVYKDFKGTLYITANCSTGSKLYGFTDDIPDYIQYYNQTFSATFGVLDFKKEGEKLSLSVTSYDVDTLKVTDGPYIFEREVTSEHSSVWVIILVIVLVLLLLLVTYLIYRIMKRRRDNMNSKRTSSLMINSATPMRDNYNDRYNSPYNNPNLDGTPQMSYSSHYSSISSYPASSMDNHPPTEYGNVRNNNDGRISSSPQANIPQNSYFDFSPQENNNINNDESLPQHLSIGSIGSKNGNVSSIHSSVTGSSRQKNFFDAGSNVELNKDLYLRTLNSLRNHKYVGYVNPVERQEKNQSFSSQISQSTDGLYSKSMDIQTSKSNIQRPFRSFDAQPSKSYVTHPSKSFDVQTTGLFDSPVSRSPTMEPTEISYESGQPLSMSLDGITEEVEGINPVTASGMIISKDEINNKKMGLSSLSKIEEPDISLTSIEGPNESIDEASALPNISNVDVSQVQEIDISLSSVGRNEDMTTEVGNIVEPSFNFEVKNPSSSKTSSGLISSPSLASQPVSSPKFTGTTRNNFGLKRMSPLYLTVSNTKPNVSAKTGNIKIQYQNGSLLRSPKQTYTNIPSPRKSSFTSENEDNNLKINLNKFNENDINKIRITKDNVDDILL
ncbi:Non-catalytic module family DOC2, partial [Piromyces sp. E2]